MGDVWAVLFLIGLLVRPLILLGSVGYVIVASTRIAGLTGRRDAVWQMTALHIALVAGLGLGSELLAERGSSSVLLVSLATLVQAGSILAVPLALRRRLHRLRRSPLPTDPTPDPANRARVDSEPAAVPTAATPPPVTSEQLSTANRAAWTIAVTGTLVPWVVGLGVKVYLQSQGRPTLPIADFVNPTALPILLIATLSLWSFPFLLLALVARYRILGRSDLRRSFTQRLWLVRMTYAGGMIGAVVLFVGVFRQFDTMYVIVPLGLYIIPAMALGYALGVVLVRRGWVPA